MLLCLPLSALSVYAGRSPSPFCLGETARVLVLGPQKAVQRDASHWYRTRLHSLRTGGTLKIILGSYRALLHKFKKTLKNTSFWQPSH